MKKKTTLFTCILLTACLFTGCAADNNFVPTEYAYSTDEVSALDIDVRDRQVSISASDEELIHIEGFTSSQEYYRVSVSSDRVLSMDIAYNKDWTDYIGSAKPSDSYRQISVRVPDRMLSSIAVDTTNENISISGLGVTGSIDLSSNGGNVYVSKADAPSIRLETKNGNISGAVAGSINDYSIDTSGSKKGECNLSDRTGGSKLLRVKANNGDINISFTE